ncbi:MAG: hypothetical protein HYU66_05420 [Armatimonadetes bacterium]|nr:hypothetical protein [Armatimonadota bacterium]
MSAPDAVLGVDPGHRKCGLAGVDAEGGIVFRCVAPRETLEEVLSTHLANYPLTGVVVGDGTCSAEVVAVVRALAGELPVVVRDEYGTTLEARRYYWRLNPPRGLWRLVPTSLRVPPAPFDDLVAVILAQRWQIERRGTS